MKIQRAKINLTISLIVDGWMVNEVYYMSGTDAAKAVQKDESSFREFIASKAANSLSDKDKSFREVINPEGKGTRVTLRTLEAVFAYWNYQSFKGNVHAYVLVSALGLNNLQRLYDVAFQGTQKSEQEYDQQREDTRDELLKKLMASREMCRIAHGGFQKTCMLHHYPANHAHDYLTLMICGMDASRAKELEMILSGDPNIGLDHYNFER